jgi:hypothetical protein
MATGIWNWIKDYSIIGVALFLFILVIISAIARDATPTSLNGILRNTLSVHESENNFSGQIIAAPINLKGICLIQVKPDRAKDDGQAYPAIIDCALNPVIGDKVIITDYTITPPHHLPDMVHIAEKTK